jgi:hypothetical protein
MSSGINGTFTRGDVDPSEIGKWIAELRGVNAQFKRAQDELYTLELVPFWKDDHWERFYAAEKTVEYASKRRREIIRQLLDAGVKLDGT